MKLVSPKSFSFLALFFALFLHEPIFAAPEVSTDSVFVKQTDKLKKISNSKKQLWVVGYANSTIENAIKDLEASLNNGADAIVFEGGYEKLDETLTALRKIYPDKPIGVNCLCSSKSYVETFELAKKHKLQIAWTDFSGVDLIEGYDEFSLQEIDKLKPEGVFYVSGIHMKYSTLQDPTKTIEKSAQQAIGWMDGIVITGTATGVATDPERARRARAVIGDYPMGAASGVSAENVNTIIQNVDFMLVNTSISDLSHRILPEKVKALRQAIDQASILK